MSPPIHPSQEGRCRLKRTVLLVGEGPMDWAFLRHVVGCFVHRDSPVAAKVEHAHGGDPSEVIIRARNLLRQRAYDRCIVLMDTDRPWPASLPSNIGRTPVTFLGAKPAIEGLLLHILEHPGITINTTSSECKRMLHRDYVDEKRRTDPIAYERLFTRDLLINRQSSCPALDTILRALG